MKILIAVDDSPHSRSAVEFLAKSRWPAGSRIIVISVVPILPPMTPPDMPMNADYTEALRPQAEAAVKHAEAVLRRVGLCAEGRVLVGEPGDALVHAAQDERADLLVLGSHGRTGFARLLLGSVSSHAVNHAPCSVLVVKKPGAK